MRGLNKVATTRDGRGRARGWESADDRIEGSPSKQQTQWDTVLVWFMRIAALVWIAKGLATWAEILDVLPGGRPFESEPLGRQAVIVYLAVIDFVAAIGLWLTSAWGGVVWLLAATSTLTLALTTPQLLPMSLPFVIAQAVFVAIYFVISFAAAREIR
ncbi:DUF6163 family protein [Methylobacterium organophilum]|uniref:DoxX family protein n=1 Tax=Methylobacterium organophilum TaxID=410 RepID=A0ABQ4T877_METOR|nr:DUF6163 family protein [Methylobacterium organophilum]UMY16369.1 DUF6163 family protein [Methylobacterium organophilum]GJE27080.1 hypothetical protein LKMONMHP_1936 [Methylobacterium organophilum]